jgi:hypothetical protein
MTMESKLITNAHDTHEDIPALLYTNTNPSDSTQQSLSHEAEAGLSDPQYDDLSDATLLRKKDELNAMSSNRGACPRTCMTAFTRDKAHIIPRGDEPTDFAVIFACFAV